MANPASFGAPGLTHPAIHQNIPENELPPIQTIPQDPATRLKSAKSRAEAMEAIFEIVRAQIGGAEAALYVIESDQSTLRLIGSRGIAAHVLIRMGAGRIGEAALNGKEYIVDTGVSPSGKATDDRLTICLPLACDETPAFVLAVYGLLPPKKHLQKKDTAIIHFLKEHAGPMLGRFPE